MSLTILNIYMHISICVQYFCKIMELFCFGFNIFCLSTESFVYLSYLQKHFSKKKTRGSFLEKKIEKRLKRAILGAFGTQLIPYLFLFMIYF